MSEENVAIVRSIWSADRRRDWSTVYAVYHPEIVWEDLAGLWGDWGRARGPEGVRVAWARWHEAFEPAYSARDEALAAAGLEG